MWIHHVPTKLGNQRHHADLLKLCCMSSTQAGRGFSTSQISTGTVPKEISHEGRMQTLWPRDCSILPMQLVTWICWCNMFLTLARFNGPKLTQKAHLLHRNISANLKPQCLKWHYFVVRNLKLEKPRGRRKKCQISANVWTAKTRPLRGWFEIPCHLSGSAGLGSPIVPYPTAVCFLYCTPIAQHPQ